MSTPIPTRRFLGLAGSAFVVLAAEPLFLLVDTAVVGRLGRVPLAALGAAGTLMTLLAILGTSLVYGTTGRAARWFGSGRTDRAIGEGVQASWLGLGIGLVAALVGQVIAGPATRLLVGSAGEVAEAAESWLRIAVWGLPGVMLILAGNGWMRGIQETRTPVLVVLSANALSAIASPLLVHTAGWGLNGSAVANVVAQTLGGALCVLVLVRRRVPLRPHWSQVRSQLVISRDLVLRSAAFQACFLTAAGVAGRMGSAELAAHQVGMQLWNFSALLLDSFAIAAQSIVGAALGAGDATGARRTARRVVVFGIGAGLTLAAAFAAGWAVLPGLFTSDAAVLDRLDLLWPILLGMLPVAGLLFALDGVLFGSGDFAFLRTITLLAAAGGYIPVALAAWWFDWGITGVWAGLAWFVLLRCLAVGARVRGDRWVVLGETR